jgi:hypothetical protein
VRFANKPNVREFDVPSNKPNSNINRKRNEALKYAESIRAQMGEEDGVELSSASENENENYENLPIATTAAESASATAQTQTQTQTQTKDATFEEPALSQPIVQTATPTAEKKQRQFIATPKRR